MSRLGDLIALLADLTEAEPEGDRERVVHGALRDDLEKTLDHLGGEDGAGVSGVLLDCNQMTGPHQTWLRTITQLTYPEPAHATMAVTRYGRAAEHLDGHATRFAEARDRGLLPVRRNLERLLASIEGYLAGAVTV